MFYKSFDHKLVTTREEEHPRTRLINIELKLVELATFVGTTPIGAESDRDPVLVGPKRVCAGPSKRT